MGKSFFISGLLVLLVSTAWAQKKISYDIRLIEKMPASWGQSVVAVITLTDSNKHEVKSMSTDIHPDKNITIDISSLQPGVYTLRVNPEHMKGLSNEFTTTITKQKMNQYIQLTFSTVARPNFPANMKKPVIYLYPQQTEDVTVKVNLKGELTQTIPVYNDGWKVSAAPDGSITNYADGHQYPYLFWEGNTNKQDWDMTEGFVVSRVESRKFLEQTLSQMGLVAREYNEFIEFWMPELQKNEYNLIHFAGREYTDIATLTIDPKPDAVLRVFMVFKPATKNTQVITQHFNGFVRKGFTVVEWGGLRLGKEAAL